MVRRLDDLCSHHITALELQVSKVADSGVHVVTLYQMCSSVDLIKPETSFALIELCENLLTKVSAVSAAGPPIVVHCRNGSEKSPVFISMLSLIQQIRSDKRVDVFQTARTTKSQRCSAFQCFVCPLLCLIPHSSTLETLLSDSLLAIGFRQCPTGSVAQLMSRVTDSVLISANLYDRLDQN